MVTSKVCPCGRVLASLMCSYNVATGGQPVPVDYNDIKGVATFYVHTVTLKLRTIKKIFLAAQRANTLLN